jgi:flagellar motility protein MotE (MotC chaperone)
MTRLFKSKWAAIAVGVICYLLTTVALWKPPPVVPRTSAHPAPSPGEDILSVLNRNNPDIDQLVAELKQQKDALTKREQQLNELALRLQTERAEINSVTQNLFRMQSEFDKNVVRVREEETANLKRLAKVYAAMTPEGAASVLRELPDEQAVKVLLFMKDAETAPILEAMTKAGDKDARRVAALSERIRLSLPRAQTPKTQTQ